MYLNVFVCYPVYTKMICNSEDFQAIVVLKLLSHQFESEFCDGNTKDKRQDEECVLMATVS